MLGVGKGFWRSVFCCACVVSENADDNDVVFVVFGLFDVVECLSEFVCCMFLYVVSNCWIFVWDIPTGVLFSAPRCAFIYSSLDSSAAYAGSVIASSLVLLQVQYVGDWRFALFCPPFAESCLFSSFLLSDGPFSFRFVMPGFCCSLLYNFILRFPVLSVFDVVSLLCNFSFSC